MKDFSFPLIFTGESKNMNSSRNAGLGCWDKYRERVLTLYELKKKEKYTTESETGRNCSYEKAHCI